MKTSKGVTNSIVGERRLYSYICVHRPSKQSISKEISCGEHEYMNMCFPSYIACYATENKTAQGLF